MRREIIGPPDCPLMHRWTLISRRSFKLLVHHFLPNRDDRDMHDHPRPFWTLVLRGSYEDLVPCPWCAPDPSHRYWCPHCRDTRVVLGDMLRRGSLRYRKARYTHRTHTGRAGAWTIVLMGPIRRPWGFWRHGVFWPWRLYEEEFGFGMRCETDERGDTYAHRPLA